MRSPVIDHDPISREMTTWERYKQIWITWRESVAGALIVTGLCWPFILPSFLPVHWWAIMPCAIVGGFLRQRSHPRSKAVLLPLWLFFLVLLLFALYAASFHPLSVYGRQKIIAFAVGAGLAYLAARKQAPLTAELFRGIRWGLIGAFVGSLIVIFMTRSLYLDQQTFGLQALNQSVSLTALPLVFAMGITGLLPGRVTPIAIFYSGSILLLGAAVEIFIRSRFHAVLLCALAVVVLLGPPWRNIFWRMMVFCLLAIIGAGIFVNLLPLMGDSFLYLSWLNPENIAGRGPIWEVALNGFWNHPLGQGIGSFEQTNFVFSYPHNMILEAAYEMGILGLLSMLAIYAVMFHKICKLWVSPPHRTLAAMTALVFLHVLKSGDISTIAFHWVFLYLFIGATPLALSWPLVSGRSVQ